MIRKIFKTLLLFFVILLTGSSIYIGHLMRFLPWQRPLFETIRPETPRDYLNKKVLIFSKTNGFRHASIEPGIEALRRSCNKKGWKVFATENGSFFDDDLLKSIKVVVFLSTTGDVLTSDQKRAFEKFIQNGGGFVGIHSAADTEHHWAWYGKLLGTYFQSHTLFPQQIPEAQILTQNRKNPAIRNLPPKWSKTDEWYNFKEDVGRKNGFTVLLALDDKSYGAIWPKNSHADHPISWIHSMGNGRMFYTGLGHTAETFNEVNSMRHIIGGIEWAGRF